MQEFVSTARTRYKQAGKTDEEINSILAPKIAEFEKALIGNQQEIKQDKGSLPRFFFDPKTKKLKKIK